MGPDLQRAAAMHYPHRLQTRFRHLRRAALLGALALGLAHAGRAQGCVAARGCGLPATSDTGEASSPWTLAVTYRYLNSYRHFTGTHEDKHRMEEGSQVINHSHYTDATLTRNLSPRYSLALTFPFVVHDRSSVVRNSQRVILQRFHTQSAGLGDVRLEGSGWVWDPAKGGKGNLRLTLGVALPTGKKDARDTFQTFNATTQQIVAVERTVDQSIQPGTGGWGVILGVAGFRTLGGGFTAYADAGYTLTPEEKNGVPTFRSNPYEAIISIADTYLGRIGVEYAVAGVPGLALSLGGRIEGVPVHDLVGGSNGFRRPGYSVAVEPGVSYMRGRWSTRVYVPLAVQRNRQRSVPDVQQSLATGTPRTGDAAFADYLFLCSVSCAL